MNQKQWQLSRHLLNFLPQNNQERKRQIYELNACLAL